MTRRADDRQFDLFVTYLTDLPLRDQRDSMKRLDGSGPQAALCTCSQRFQRVVRNATAAVRPPSRRSPPVLAGKLIHQGRGELPRFVVAPRVGGEGIAGECKSP